MEPTMPRKTCSHFAVYVGLLSKGDWENDRADPGNRINTGAFPGR